MKPSICYVPGGSVSYQQTASLHRGHGVGSSRGRDVGRIPSPWRRLSENFSFLSHRLQLQLLSSGRQQFIRDHVIPTPAHNGAMFYYYYVISRGRVEMHPLNLARCY
jgi:hypothetical protein